MTPSTPCTLPTKTGFSGSQDNRIYPHQGGMYTLFQLVWKKCAKEGFLYCIEEN